MEQKKPEEIPVFTSFWLYNKVLSVNKFVLNGIVSKLYIAFYIKLLENA